MKLSSGWILGLCLGLPFFLMGSLLCWHFHTLNETSVLLVFLAAFGLGTIPSLLKNLPLQNWGQLFLAILGGAFFGKIVLSCFHFMVTVETTPLFTAIFFLLFSFLGGFLVWGISGKFLLILWRKFPTELQNPGVPIILDQSALTDPRLLEICMSGLFDGQLILPEFLLQDPLEDFLLSKYKMLLNSIAKLQTLPNLKMQVVKAPLEEEKDALRRSLALARRLRGKLLISDSALSHGSMDGIPLLNLYHLTSNLKPPIQTGDHINIKIQRLGKDPSQGVGYMDDGSMIVVNGAGAQLQQTVNAVVLSVRYTTSGRLVFCNLEEEKKEICEEKVMTQQEEFSLVERSLKSPSKFLPVKN